MRHHWFIIVTTLGLGTGACSVTEVNPLASGLFPCESAEDCPPQQSCVVGQCWVEDPPQVEIVAPEGPLGPEPAEATAFPIAPGQTEPVMVPVTISGRNLSLVPAAGDPVFGEGNVVVYLDGEEVAVLTEGDLENRALIEVAVPADEPGAHRIRAVARMANNVIYDNPGAEGRGFFWLDDGLPQVGFVHPFPGDVFPLEATSIEFTVATHNFVFERVSQSTIPDGAPVGHAHVHYQQDFPSCVCDSGCDNGYVGVVAPQGPDTVASSRLQIPDSAAGPAKLTSVLRAVNHFKWLYDDGSMQVTCPDDPVPVFGVPIWEDITIRREDIGPFDDPFGDTDTDGDFGG